MNTLNIIMRLNFVLRKLDTQLKKIKKHNDIIKTRSQYNSKFPTRLYVIFKTKVPPLYIMT